MSKSDVLERNGVTKVENLQKGRFIYCIYDELANEFTLPFIASDDVSAKRSVYELCMQNVSPNFLYRYQTSLTLYRVGDISDGLRFNDFVMNRVDGVSAIISTIGAYDIAEVNKKLKLEDDVKLDLPEFINKESEEKYNAEVQDAV